MQLWPPTLVILRPRTLSSNSSLQNNPRSLQKNSGCHWWRLWLFGSILFFPLFFRLFHFFYRRLPSYFPLQWTLTVFGKLVQFCLCFCYSVCPVVLCFSVSNFESFGARSALIPVATDSSYSTPGESPNVCSLARGRWGCLQDHRGPKHTVHNGCKKLVWSGYIPDTGYWY